MRVARVRSPGGLGGGSGGVDRGVGGCRRRGCEGGRGRRGCGAGGASSGSAAVRQHDARKRQRPCVYCTTTRRCSGGQYAAHSSAEMTSAKSMAARKCRSSVLSSASGTPAICA